MNHTRNPAHPDRRRQLAIISHSHPSVTKGGAEIAAYTLFKGLRSIGRDAMFVAACPNDARGRIELGAHEYAVFYDPVRYDHFYHVAAPDVTDQLQELLEPRAAVVNFHHYLNFGIGAVRQVADIFPTAFTLHEFLGICHHHGQMITRPAHLLCDRAAPRACATCYPEFSRQQFAIRRRFLLDCLGQIDAFVAPSHFLAERYTAWGLPANRLHVVENGLVHPASPSHVTRPEEHVWTFGFFGQINPFKGVDLILKACDLIARRRDLGRRVRIRIHGNFIGQPAEFVERFQAAVARHEFLSYLGPYDNAAVGRLMTACDYVLVPSSWWENSPVVIQEAYAAGRPVLCTGIGGMAEKVVNGVTGLHFDHNDPSSFVAAVERGASAVTFGKLCESLPPVSTAGTMAQEYMKILNHIGRSMPRGGTIREAG